MSDDQHDTSQTTAADPDRRFWEMSFDIQVRLGKSEAEARAHADAYLAGLKTADKEAMKAKKDE